MFLNELKGAILFLVQYVLFLDELTFSPRLFLEALGLFLVDSLYIVILMRLFLDGYSLFLVQYVLFLDDF
jgi:ABC-type transporter Mla maintaining outer membrane lipid asymmetry permease subunit MlaE